MPSPWFPPVRSTHLLAQSTRLSRCDSSEIACCALEVITHCVWEFLVRIIGSTRPYLKFCAVCIAAACYIQAFASKGLDSSPCEGPFLSSRFTAGLDSNSRSVGVRGGCQAFGCFKFIVSRIMWTALNEEYVPLLRPGSRRSSPLKLDTYSTSRDIWFSKKEHVRRSLRLNREG